MSQFYPCIVSNIVKETEDAVAVTIVPRKEDIDKFNFEAGQYLTFKQTINGEEIRRSYSICSAPYENKLTVAVKKVPNGRFSTFANEDLKIGDKLECMPPTGLFVRNKTSDASKFYVGFASGSGITPVISLIKCILNEDSEASFMLFYGNKKTESIIFKEELEALKNVYLSRFSLYHVLSRDKFGTPLFTGRIDKSKLDIFANSLFDSKDVTQFFLCGPQQMTLDLKESLIDLGVDPKKIKFELFGTDPLKTKEQSKELEEKYKGKISNVQLTLDGITLEFPLEYQGLSILDAALEQGADLPFACKGGVCATCKARVTDGEVDMDINYALEKDELDKGFVLTCQSHPRSENISVDFDQSS